MSSHSRWHAGDVDKLLEPAKKGGLRRGRETQQRDLSYDESVLVQSEAASSSPMILSGSGHRMRCCYGRLTCRFDYSSFLRAALDASRVRHSAKLSAGIFQRQSA